MGKIALRFKDRNESNEVILGYEYEKQKSFFGDFLSTDLGAKTLRVNKSAMKTVWKKICRSDTKLNYMSCHSVTKLKHTKWTVWEAKP